MDVNIEHVMASLAERRKVFCSEADFQFALAWEIQNAYPNFDIRLEYCPTHISTSMHLDILVSCDGGGYPMELKYMTLGLDSIVDGERFVLKNHGAQDCGKYDFLKDIARVERLVTADSKFREGYVIFLSNDPIYWSMPVKMGTCDAAFRIHEGVIKSGRLAWADHTGIGTNRGREVPIELHGSYCMSWRDYSRISDARGGCFRYLAIKVPK